jgi:hypothetical protein
MRGGELARSADIQELGGTALRQATLEFERFNGTFGLQSIHIHYMII